MRKTALLPVVTTCRDVSPISKIASTTMKYELTGSELWEQLIPAGRFGVEHSRKIIISEE